MDTAAFAKYSTLLESVAKQDQARLKKLFKTLKVDWSTGSVSEVKRDAIQAAFTDDKDGRARAKYFEYLISEGFVVAKSAPGEQNTFPVPWRALSDVNSAMTFQSAHWDYLGIKPKATPESVRKGWAKKFGQVPEIGDKRLGGLIEAAGVAPRHGSGSIALPAGGSGWPGIGGERSVPEVPVGPKADTPVITGADVAALAALAAAAYQCLKDAPWSIDRDFWGVPLGPRVCISRECADKLQEVLLGSAATEFMSILKAFVAKGLSLSSLLEGAGSWVALALLHFSVHWGALIAANKTNNGVCLTFFFAWWRPFTLGILNGYAKGR